MQTAQGSLVLLNLHTEQPEVFWNGRLVEGVQRIHSHHDEDEHRVKLVVKGNQDALYVEMVDAGIQIKKVVA
jgi:hypothetical protein